jgi:hypothetical protein
MVLVAAVWIAYWPALDAPLIFDDLVLIPDNPSILKLWPLVAD